MRRIALIMLATAWLSVAVQSSAQTVRVATFNASLNRQSAGELLKGLESGADPQIANVAEVIQRARPDIVLINEFDFDPTGRAPRLFAENYLARGQGGAESVAFEYMYSNRVNTGVASGADLDRNGRIADRPGDRDYGGDCKGFGLFPGQYGMVLYSRFPIASGQVRTFTDLLWSEMPGALLPTDANGEPWYTAAALQSLPLSSKSHWDIPIEIGGKVVHVLASHPTPPAFDGVEDRNGKRNHDEIRFWADYVTGGDCARYIHPDRGCPPVESPPDRFVIVGDLNADPSDGGSLMAIKQLLEHPRIDSSFTPRSTGGVEASRDQGGANRGHRGDPSADTADFNDQDPGNLRVDYVLPSKGLEIRGGGVFWPDSTDRNSRLVTMRPTVATSDHRLVWLDIEIK